MKSLVIILAILQCISCTSVNNISNSNKEDVSTRTNLDSLILSEITCISVDDSSKIGKNNTECIELLEIPLKSKTDSSIFFQKGNLYTSEVIVNILTGNFKIKEIIYQHYKLGVILPDSVVNDIIISKLSENQCKVFRSVDKKRIYIIIRDVKKHFEVTWVINNDKYYARFVDKDI